jgi:hypothetical protein
MKYCSLISDQDTVVLKKLSGDTIIEFNHPLHGVWAASACLRNESSTIEIVANILNPEFKLEFTSFSIRMQCPDQPAKKRTESLHIDLEAIKILIGLEHDFSVQGWERFSALTLAQLLAIDTNWVCFVYGLKLYGKNSVISLLQTDYQGTICVNLEDNRPPPLVFELDLDEYESFLSSARVGFEHISC